jgi:DNA-binding MarR family transcriptional regulator
MVDQNTRHAEQDSRHIARAVLQLGRRLRAQRPGSALSLPQLALLATLHQQGKMRASHLAAHQRLRPQSLTRLIAGLERKGLIVRRADPDDGRGRLIELSRAGRESLAQDMRPRRTWLSAAMLQALTPTEQSLLRLSAELMLRIAHIDEVKVLNSSGTS